MCPGAPVQTGAGRHPRKRLGYTRRFCSITPRGQTLTSNNGAGSGYQVIMRKPGDKEKRVGRATVTFHVTPEPDSGTIFCSVVGVGLVNLARRST